MHYKTITNKVKQSVACCLFLALLLFIPSAEAHYWEIDYAPNLVGVVEGENDNIGSVLNQLKCPFVLIHPEALPTLAADSPDVKILLIEGSPLFQSGNTLGDGEKLAGVIQFLRKGGQVFITGKADYFINAVGRRGGIKMYAPTHAGEQIYQGPNVTVPVTVTHDTTGALKEYLGNTTIALQHPTLRSQHSIMNLESLACGGSVLETTAFYVLRWVQPSPAGADWRTEGKNFITSFIFPFQDTPGRVHYVNYPLDSAYRSGGEKTCPVPDR